MRIFLNSFTRAKGPIFQYFNIPILNPLGRGAESAHTFFKHQFLQEKMVLEVSDFLTFLIHYKLIENKKNRFFTVILGDLEATV